MPAPSFVIPSQLESDVAVKVETVESVAVRKVISEETSKQVREALESVVAKGTGRNAFIDGYRVGGKTGTAE